MYLMLPLKLVSILNLLRLITISELTEDQYTKVKLLTPHSMGKLLYK